MFILFNPKVPNFFILNLKLLYISGLKTQTFVVLVPKLPFILVQKI